MLLVTDDRLHPIDVTMRGQWHALHVSQ